MSTNPPQPTTPRPPLATYRELAGLFLLLCGAGAVLIAAYHVSPDLGLALSGALAIAGGLALTVRSAP